MGLCHFVSIPCEKETGDRRDVGLRLFSSNPSKIAVGLFWSCTCTVDVGLRLSNSIPKFSGLRWPVGLLFPPGKFVVGLFRCSRRSIWMLKKND